MSAFHVGRVDTLNTTETTNVKFTSSNIILNVPVKVPTTQFIGFASGLYWFHLSVGVPENSATYLRLNDLVSPTVISASNSIFTPENGVTIDSIQIVSPSTILTVSTTCTIFSSQNFETSLLGIRLDNIMSPMKAFSVRTSCIFTSTQFSLISFDQILINEGNLFISDGNKFTTTERGTYIFSLNMNISPTHLRLTVNNKTIKNLSARGFQGFTVLSSRAMGMVTLKEHDVIQLETMQHHGVIIQAVKTIITFTCFLYNPISYNHIAWSVVAGSTGIYSGPLDYQSFDIILVNMQNPWKANTNRAVIPVPGIYFVDITANLCGSFWPKKGDEYAEKQVLLNGFPIMIIRLCNVTQSYCFTRSRSTIAHLKVGDELRVKIPTRGQFYSSDDGHHESFTGFLLQASL